MEKEIIEDEETSEEDSGEETEEEEASEESEDEEDSEEVEEEDAEEEKEEKEAISFKREMHKATCADCGKACEVPFKPTEGRAVYCRDCYQKHRPQRRRF